MVRVNAREPGGQSTGDTRSGESTSWSRSEGLSVIRSAVADNLALDIDEVKPESRLITDLGADSLDFVDLIFVLERHFGVKIREGEFDFLARLDVTAPGTLEGDYLTRSAVDKLLPWLPALRNVEDHEKVMPAQLFSMITVETLWLMVESKRSG